MSLTIFSSSVLIIPVKQSKKGQSDSTPPIKNALSVLLPLGILCAGSLYCGCWSSSNNHGIFDTQEGEIETISPDYNDLDRQEVDFEADFTIDSLEEQDEDVSDSETAEVCPTLIHEFGPVMLASGDVYAYPPDRGAGGWLIPLMENHGYTTSILALPLSDESLTPGTPVLVAEGPSGQVGWMHGFLWNGEDYIGFFNPAGSPPSIVHMIRLDASGEPLGLSVPLEGPSDPTRGLEAQWIGETLSVAYSKYLGPTDENEVRYRRFNRFLEPITSPLTILSAPSTNFSVIDLEFGGSLGLILWVERQVDLLLGTHFFTSINLDGELGSEKNNISCIDERRVEGMSALWTGDEYLIFYGCLHQVDINDDSYFIKLNADVQPSAPSTELMTGSGPFFLAWDGTAIDFVAVNTTPELFDHFDLFRYHPDSGSLDGPILSKEGIGILAVGLVFRDGWLLLVWLEGPIGTINIYAEGWHCL